MKMMMLAIVREATEKAKLHELTLESISTFVDHFAGRNPRALLPVMALGGPKGGLPSIC